MKPFLEQPVNDLRDYVRKVTIFLFLISVLFYVIPNVRIDIIKKEIATMPHKVCHNETMFLPTLESLGVYPSLLICDVGEVKFEERCYIIKEKEVCVIQ